MNSKGAFFDDHVRPDPRKQLPLAHDFASALDERDEDVELATADLYWGLAFQQPAFGGVEPKRTELDAIASSTHSGENAWAPEFSTIDLRVHALPQPSEGNVAEKASATEVRHGRSPALRVPATDTSRDQMAAARLWRARRPPYRGAGGATPGSIAA